MNKIRSNNFNGICTKSIRLPKFAIRVVNSAICILLVGVADVPDQSRLLKLALELNICWIYVIIKLFMS